MVVDEEGALDRQREPTELIMAKSKSWKSAQARKQGRTAPIDAARVAERFVRGPLAIERLPGVLEQLEDAIAETNQLRATAQVSLDRPGNAKPGTYLEHAPPLALLCAIRDSMPTEVSARAILSETIDAYRHFRGRTAIVAGLNAATAQVAYLYDRFYEAETSRLDGIARSQAARDLEKLEREALDTNTMQRYLQTEVTSFRMPGVEEAIMEPAKIELARKAIEAAKAAIEEPYRVLVLEDMRREIVLEIAARRKTPRPTNTTAWASDLRLRMAVGAGRLAKAGLKNAFAIQLSAQPEELELAAFEKEVAEYEVDVRDRIAQVIIDLHAERQSAAYRARMAECEQAAAKARAAVVPIHDQPLEARVAAVVTAFMQRNSVLTPFSRLMAPEGIEILTRSELVVGPGQPRVQAEIEISCLRARVTSAKVTLPEGAFIKKGFAGRVHAPAPPAQTTTSTAA